MTVGEGFEATILISVLGTEIAVRAHFGSDTLPSELHRTRKIRYIIQFRESW